MIARSDRVVPFSCDSFRGTKRMASCCRFDSPDDGPVKANRWGAKAEPPVFNMPGGFAVNALMQTRPAQSRW